MKTNKLFIPHGLVCIVLKVNEHCWRINSALIVKMQLLLLCRSIPCSTYYYIDRGVLLENAPLIKFIRNYIRDQSGVFPYPQQ